MVLLAATMHVASNKWHLLVQNCWHGKQFFVMDEDYFNACCATVYFVQTPQPAVQRRVAPRSAAVWVEADGGDSPDAQDGENE
jgi:hypothetical protein